MIWDEVDAAENEDQLVVNLGGLMVGFKNVFTGSGGLNAAKALICGAQG